MSAQRPPPKPQRLRRRTVLCRTAAAAAWLHGGVLHAAAEAPDGLSESQHALLALGYVAAPSSAIALVVPADVDNGAFVPVSVRSALAGTREIALLVSSNPEPLAARFDIADGTEAFVATRLKMAGSGDIYAIVRTDSGMHFVRTSAVVAVGGCA